MPAIKSGDLILVTGASGYLGAHTAVAFLDKGYNVRGTVRTQSKGEYLKNIFEGKKGHFEYALVEDIGKEDCFDEAVKGVDAVAHTASPYHFDADEPDELFIPAVKGTVGVLKSCKKNNPNVKRVVITSSVAAIIDSDKTPPHTFTEKDWNPVSIPACEKEGRNASGSNKYRASKTLAEQAFWKFFTDEKPAFDGAVINPPLVSDQSFQADWQVLGPIIHECDKPSSLNTSVAAFYEWMSGKHKQEDLPAPGLAYIDVRDCAKAHARALEVEEAGGERFICSAGPLSGNDYCLALNKNFPDIKDVPKGDHSAKASIDAKINVFDGSKCSRVLGIQYTELATCIVDMVKSLQQRFD